MPYHTKACQVQFTLVIHGTCACFCRLCLTGETFNNVRKCGQCRCTYLQLVECRPNEDNLLVVYYEWFGIKSTCKCNVLKTANEAVWPKQMAFFKIFKKTQQRSENWLVKFLTLCPNKIRKDYQTMITGDSW